MLRAIAFAVGTLNKDYPYHLNTLPGPLFKTDGTTSKSSASLLLLGFRFFELPVKGSFQRSITVLFSIGLKFYLRLEVECLLSSCPVSSGQYSRTRSNLSKLNLRGYHTLWLFFPEELNFPRENLYERSYKTTSLLHFYKRFSLP